MYYNNIKGSGLNVSKLCLGTMTFGGQTDEETSLRIMDFAVDNGVNFFDTADIYTGGISEQIVGKALEGKRENVVIATKVSGSKTRPPKPNGSGLGRKHIITNLEDSLKSLRTDYVDLLYLHFPDPTTPVEEVIETMTELIRSGKIRYYGLSNYSAWQCCQFIHTAKEMNAIAPIVTESVYNLITRGLDDEMAPFLSQYKMGLSVYNPIAAGLLTGKHKGTTPNEGTRFALEKGYAMRYWNGQNLDAVSELTKIAEEAGMGLLEFSLVWLTNRPVVDSIIMGVSKYEQLVENVSYFNERKSLTAETMQKCDEIWNSIKGSYYSYHR